MGTSIATWQQHKCARQHREYRTWIECAIGSRRIAWVLGDGPYATISWCGAWNEVSVTLHSNLADAVAALKQINRTGCSGRCSRTHQVVEVVL